MAALKVAYGWKVEENRSGAQNGVGRWSWEELEVRTSKGKEKSCQGGVYIEMYVEPIDTTIQSFILNCILLVLVNLKFKTSI